MKCKKCKQDMAEHGYDCTYRGLCPTCVCEEYERLQAIVDRYEPTHKALRLYVSARNPTTVGAIIASEQIVELFCEADAPTDSERKSVG